VWARDDRVGSLVEVKEGAPESTHTKAITAIGKAGNGYGDEAEPSPEKT